MDIFDTLSFNHLEAYQKILNIAEKYKKSCLGNVKIDEVKYDKKKRLVKIIYIDKKIYWYKILTKEDFLKYE